MTRFFSPILVHNKSYPRVLVALSGPFSSVTNRTPGLGGFSRPTFIHNETFSGPFVSVPNRVPGLGGSFWRILIRNKSYPGSWWLFLAHSCTEQIVAGSC